LTANFMAPEAGFAAWHAPGYAEKFAVCSFCEQSPWVPIPIYMKKEWHPDELARHWFVSLTFARFTS
jgi:hypothetical protein